MGLGRPASMLPRISPLFPNGTHVLGISGDLAGRRAAVGRASRPRAWGPSTKPNRSSFLSSELWEVQNGFLGRRPPLTLVGPGNMVKFFCFAIECPMNFILQPWQLLFMVFASWVHREQQKIIEFYQAELKAVRSVTTSYTFQREFSRCTGGEPPFSFRSVDLRGAGTNMEPWKTQRVRRRNMTIVSRISFVRQKTSPVPFDTAYLNQRHAAG